MKLKRICCLLLAGLMMITVLQLPVEVSAAHENTYVNTGNYRADLIGVAKTQVGYRETLNNKTKYGEWYGLDYNPWCAMFVSWCARQAKIPTSVIGNSAVADPYYGYFDVECRDGKDYTPVPGDLFFKRGFTHVGIVYYVDGDYFYSLEGNTNNSGSDNGTHVMCLRHRIKDVYFGVYDNSSVPAPAGPAVSTSQKTYTSGQTIRINWTEVADAVSYSVVLYKNGEIYYSGDAGTATFFDLKNTETGTYLISVAAHYSDGKTGYGQHAITVSAVPTLSVLYNTNGGDISHEYQYIVIGGEGAALRATASTSAAKDVIIPVGTLLTASQVKNVSGYTWAETEYGGKTGWCIVSDGFCERVGYRKNADGDILQYPDEGLAVTTWNAGSGETKGMLDPQTAGLTKENHTFVGWSKTPDGSGTVFRQDQTDISAEQIDESFGYSYMAVKMYAVWRKTVSAITVETLPAKTEYFTDDSLDASGLTIRAKYADGTEEVIASGFTCSGFDSSTVGTKKVTVTYCGATAEFEVNVGARMQYAIEDGAAVVTRYEQGSGVVIIPNRVEGVPVTAIAPGAFADCSQITGVIIPSSITEIGDGAFAGCSGLTVVNYTGSKEQWDAITIGNANEILTGATLNCNYLVMGDYTGDLQVDNNDVIYLLWHTLFPKQFPVAITADLNGDGVVNNSDVIDLLWHTLFPEQFPLVAAVSEEDSTDESAEESTAELTEKPVDEPTEEPIDEPTEEPAEEPTEEPAGEPTEEPAEEPTEEPAGEPTEEPAEEPTGESSGETNEELTEASAESLPQEA